MTKKILVLGCSHVSGQGFEDVLSTARISKYAWPSIISKDFDCEVINQSSPGQSPTYCVEKIQNFPNKESLSAIMVVWPHSERSLQRITRPNSVEEDVPYHNNSIGNPRWDTAIKNYFLICHNWRIGKVNLMSYVGYVKWLASELNIPVWMSTSTNEDHNFLQSKNISLNTPSDWYSFCQTNCYPQLPDGHYGHKAHEIFYQKYVKSWIQENLFDTINIS